MAAVPSYDSLRIAPRGQSGFSISVPSTEGFDQPARQVARAAQNATQAGSVLSDIAISAQNEANQTRVMEAANAAREAALRLAYDPAEGYTRVKGGEVLPRDGKPLAVDYTGKFDEQLATIGGTLANDAQRRMFQAEAMRMRSSFEAGAMEHEAREWSGYQLSVADGSRELAIEEIAKARNDPAAIDAAKAQLDFSVLRLGQLKGLSGNEIVAMQAVNWSAAIRQSIAAALSDEDLATAEGLFNRYGDGLTEADEIAIEGPLHRALDGKLVMQVADVAEGLAPIVEGADGGTHTAAPVKALPTGGDATVEELVKGYNDPGFAAIIWQESRNGRRDVGLVGVPTQWGRAVGVGQVLDSTGRQMASRLGLAWRPELMQQRSRAAYDYQLKIAHAYWQEARANTTNLADAARYYHGGPNRALWGPKTEKYARKVVSSAGGNSTPGRSIRPATLEEMWSAARAELERRRPDASAELVRAARGEVEARWSMRERSQAAAEDSTMQQVYTALAGNGGSVSALPTALRSSIPGDKLPSVYEFARSIQRSDDLPESDPVTYLRLSDPAALVATSDSEFLSLKPKLTDSDFQQFARDRASARSALAKGAQTAAQQAGALPREAVNRVVNARLATLGLPTAPKADDPELQHVAGVKIFVDRALLSEQARLGRQMTDAELTAFVDRLFAMSIRTRRGGRASVLGQAPDRMSANDRASAIEALRQAGVAEPTEADILATYYQYAQTVARRVR